MECPIYGLLSNHQSDTAATPLPSDQSTITPFFVHNSSISPSRPTVPVWSLARYVVSEGPPLARLVADTLVHYYGFGII
jgi:hypothetical protein